MGVGKGHQLRLEFKESRPGRRERIWKFDRESIPTFLRYTGGGIKKSIFGPTMGVQTLDWVLAGGSIKVLRGGFMG